MKSEYDIYAICLFDRYQFSRYLTYRGKNLLFFIEQLRRYRTRSVDEKSPLTHIFSNVVINT